MERPPSHNWLRGFTGAAVGGGLSQFVLALYCLGYWLRNDNIKEVNSTAIPAILFGACTGFAYRFPAGKHSLGFATIVLFISFLLTYIVLGGIYASMMPRRFRGMAPSLGETIGYYVVIAISCLIPMCVLVSIRLRRFHAEWDARERCGIEAPPVEEEHE